MTTDYNYELEDATHDALAEAGFMPADYDYLAEELTLTGTDANVIGYYHAKGAADAIRIEAADASAWTLLVAWSPDGYRLTAIDENGVILSEARYSYSAMGLAWLTAALEDGER